MLRYSLSLLGLLLNLGGVTTLISCLSIMLLLRVILISLLLSFAFLIIVLVLRTTTLELLSPFSIAILTKISCFST
jgi:hypothetical protein